MNQLIPLVGTNGRTMALRQQLERDRPQIGTFLALASPVAAELCAAALDWVLIDLEHGAATEADLLGLLQAASASGTPALVRVPAIESSALGRALDAGADGIMFPHVDSPAEAVAAVAATRYPPHGTRGIARLTRARGYGRSGDPGHPLVVAQIESARAVQAAGDIARVDGVDALFVGVADLSHDLGVSGGGDDDLSDAIAAVIAAARANAKHAGLLVRGLDAGTTWSDRGARLIAVASDAALLAAATDALQALRGSVIESDEERPVQRGRAAASQGGL